MTPSPFGSVPGSGDPQAQSPGGGNPLLGGQQVPQPAGPTPDQRISGYMDQVRNISIQIDALATQHPEASEDLNQAKQAMANSMAKVAAAMAQLTSTPQPPTV